MLKRHILSKKGKQITLLRSVIMSKSAFFAEIVGVFLGMGHFLFFILFYFFCSNPLGGLSCQPVTSEYAWVFILNHLVNNDTNVTK